MNGRATWRWIIAGCLALVVGCGKGKISGTVTNSAGKALDAATVKADPAGKEAKTDSAGKYSLDEVSRGDQSVTASRTGYVSQTKAVKIGGTFKGDEATLDFALGSGFGSSHGLAGTTWTLSTVLTSGTASSGQGSGDIKFTSDTAGTFGDAGVTASVTHPADTSAEHIDNVTIVIGPGDPDEATFTGTRKGASMSGTWRYTGTKFNGSGTWSATLK